MDRIGAHEKKIVEMMVKDADLEHENENLRNELQSYEGQLQVMNTDIKQIHLSLVLSHCHVFSHLVYIL